MRYAIAIVLLTIAGAFTLLPTWLVMVRLWASDPLRMIGAIFPWVALAGVLGAWRRLGKPFDGTLWGLAPIIAALVMTRIASVTEFRPAFHYWHNISLHSAPVPFLYGAGAVLLFGGPRLLRASLAPLCLLLLLNPVPEAYNRAMDLPLQQMAANTARAFAWHIGLQPTGEQLRMMFAPDFGMMIVPGCNGVRGSITLGYLTLFVGYKRGLKPLALILTSLSAFLLGYVFNLLRLCVLVVYYRIGVSVPSIQDYGTQVDYAIGCTIFLFATLGIGYALRALTPDNKPNDEPKTQLAPTLHSGLLLRGGCLLALTLICVARDRRMLAEAFPLVPDEKAVLARFPSQVGAFQLERTYTEQLATGVTAFAMGVYVAPTGPDGVPRRLTFGLWIAPGEHTVLGSREFRGIRPQSVTAFDANALNAFPIHFGSSVYELGESRELDAEAFCYVTGCSNLLHLDSPTATTVAVAAVRKHLPILLQREILTEDLTPSQVQQARFQNDARQFVKNLDMARIIQKEGVWP